MPSAKAANSIMGRVRTDPPRSCGSLTRCLRNRAADTPAPDAGRLVYPLPLGIYVAKGNTELAEAIKATLATLKANGQYAALIKKYNLESID